MSPLLPLADDEAHVWYAWTAACSSPMQRAAYAALLTPDERARCARFAFDALEAEYLLTRALCRSVLSRYADVRPQDWRFRRNDYGRPEIDGPAGLAPLRFNLSNARSLVACVVTRRADAGVDVEETARSEAPLDIANEFFSADELRELRALPVAEQGARFFDLWTLKESYIKARGLGLQIPLDRFSMRFGTSIGIAFDAGLVDDAAAWQFHSTRLGEAHTLSLALHRGTERPFRIQLREVVPLAD
jgi:4'-phosphopantetheinyl transferase